MPNSLYAATALCRKFSPRLVPGAVWGPWWQIDRRCKCEPGQDAWQARKRSAGPVGPGLLSFLAPDRCGK